MLLTWILSLLDKTAEILKVKKFGVAQITTRACGTKGEANTIAVGTMI